MVQKERDCRPGEFFPYQIFCRRSYFGDAEVLLNSSARTGSVRCESDGSMLVFDKHDLVELMAEFPRHIWILRKAALRRETARKSLLKSHKKRRIFAHYVDLAASAIQTQWRIALLSPKPLSRRKKEVKRRGSGDLLDVGILSTTADRHLEQKFVHRRASSQRTDVPAQVDLLRADMCRMQRQLESLAKAMTEGFEKLGANQAGLSPCTLPTATPTTPATNGEYQSQLRPNGLRL